MQNLPAVRKRTRSLADSSSSGAQQAHQLHHNLRLDCSYVATSTLLPPERALRKTSQRQMKALKASMVEFGFIRPLLIDKDSRIVVGHNAWLAAKELELVEVPVVRIEHLTPEQLRLYRMMDNRSAELSAWDDDLLYAELRELTDLDLSGVFDLNLELSGFSTAEIDKRLDVDWGEDRDGALESFWS